jgi:hypothetical protein
VFPVTPAQVIHLWPAPWQNDYTCIILSSQWVFCESVFIGLY